MPEHGNPGTDQQQDHTQPKREPAATGQRLVVDHAQEQAEAFDHEAETHQGNGSALPSQQGALGSEQDAGVIEIGHMRLVASKSLKVREAQAALAPQISPADTAGAHALGG